MKTINEFVSRQHWGFVFYIWCALSHHVIRCCCFSFSALLDWIPSIVTVLCMPCHAMPPGQAAFCDVTEDNTTQYYTIQHDTTQRTITYCPILFYHIQFFLIQSHSILFCCISSLQLYCRCDDCQSIRITLFYNECKLKI